MMAPSVDQTNMPSHQRNLGAVTNNIILTNSDDTTLSSGGESNGKENSMSDGENFECYGEGEMDTSSPVSHTINGEDDGLLRSPGGGSLKRNTWLRTSLRRTPPSHQECLPNRRWGSFRQPSGKRLGSNALASQLYRSSSFNSSGRSSTCDTADDVYSDVSLEEDVLDLNHKVQMLQQQMSVLADNQTHNDERYTRAKQDNAALQAKIIMLEEQLRDVELRSEERLGEEERRHRELVARVDREKQLQVENCAIRLQALELENSSLKDEATRCRNQAEKLRSEKIKIEEQLGVTEGILLSLKEEINSLRDQERKHKERAEANQQLVEDLNLEIERLHGERNNALTNLSRTNTEPQTHLQSQLDALREDHRSLLEAHEELQAVMLTKGIEEGRNLLSDSAGTNSLAAELEAMSQDDHFGERARDELKVRSALRDAQEVNAKLRTYIDDILLLIVDNCPRLLEVRNPPAP
uniref:FIP-RBD domain-containing protein n=2 Tax=Clastoptera arizonana TaxID=38151 RepID=A0A1B6CAK6_9HEMI